MTSAALTAQQTDLRSDGEETVDVELRTIPFYALDADGQPVFDLEVHEIELWSGGEPITPDVFDHWVTTTDAIRDRPPEPRQVFMLFDQVFPKRLKASQRYAALSEQQRQPALLDVVHSGSPNQALPALHRLNGDITSTPNERGSLRYIADRPEAVQGRPIDLCSVGFQIADQGPAEPELTHYNCRALDAATPSLMVESKPPVRGRAIWGIVAVDPASGEAYLQRLELTVDEDGTVRHNQ